MIFAEMMEEQPGRRVRRAAEAFASYREAITNGGDPSVLSPKVASCVRSWSSGSARGSKAGKQKYQKKRGFPHWFRLVASPIRSKRKSRMKKTSSGLISTDP
jgi:hypothetical protein